jgi:colanic acid/amylovoran biosynthesis glycosyltransferase
MGVAPHQYRFRPRRCEPDKVLRLLTVGRLVEKKGVEYALRAVVLLRDRSIPVRYDVVGDGDLRDRLEDLADRLGISDCVNFRGWQDQHEVIRHMARNDVLLVPSVTTPDGDQEGIPVTLMEAMASGMLVVATDHSGIPELVTSGRSGVLVPERDAKGLADALADLVARPDIWPAMSRAARAHVSDEFEIGVLNRALIRIYEMLLGGSGIHDVVVSGNRRGRKDVPVACHA